MNCETRERILQILQQLGQEYPSFRFGQLVATIAFLAKGPVASAVSEVEDEEFLAAAERNLEQRVGGHTDAHQASTSPDDPPDAKSEAALAKVP